jgi:hypothetical protein
MTQSAADLESTFVRAWALFTQNLIVVVPGLVLGAVAGIVAAIVAVLLIGSLLATGATGSTAVGIASIGTTVAVAVVLVMVMAIVQTAFVTGMAGAAWETGKTTLADGWNAFTNRGGQILWMIVLMFAIGCGALILAPFTLGLSLFAYLIFFLYTSSSVIIGGREAGHAISESMHLATRNFWPTTGLAALVVLVSLIGAAVGSELSRVTPLLGGLVAAAVQQAVLAYATMVIVGEYIKLRAAETAAPAAPPAPPASP